LDPPYDSLCSPRWRLLGDTARAGVASKLPRSNPKKRVGRTADDVTGALNEDTVRQFGNSTGRSPQPIDNKTTLGPNSICSPSNTEMMGGMRQHEAHGPGNYPCTAPGNSGSLSTLPQSENDSEHVSRFYDPHWKRGTNGGAHRLSFL